MLKKISIIAVGLAAVSATVVEDINDVGTQEGGWVGETQVLVPIDAVLLTRTTTYWTEANNTVCVGLFDDYIRLRGEVNTKIDELNSKYEQYKEQCVCHGADCCHDALEPFCDEAQACLAVDACCETNVENHFCADNSEST